MRHTAKLLSLPLVLAALMLAPARAQETVPVTPVKKVQPRTIDLCICLDVSGSMKGLIHSARSRIWAIVNDLALAKPSPRLRVALYSYGGGQYDKAQGYIRLETPFTEDLDLVSQMLFKLEAAGSVELVGGVMHRALTDLSWQKDSNALKLMIVAGNETANQDPKFIYTEMARKAIQNGVMVNAIYCGNGSDQIAPEWRKISALSDGHFAAIDQHGTIDLTSPFDKELAALSASLNKTYIAFGKAGRAGQARQRVADRAAAETSSNTAALRAAAKSKKQYFNAWCLIDACERKEVDLEKVKEEDLPEYMRGKTLEEKKAIMAKKRAERTAIQKKIAEINKKRGTWMAAERARRGQEADKSFDAAVRKALRAQAKAKGYEFEK